MPWGRHRFWNERIEPPRPFPDPLAWYFPLLKKIYEWDARLGDWKLERSRLRDERLLRRRFILCASERKRKAMLIEYKKTLASED